MFSFLNNEQIADKKFYKPEPSLGEKHLSVTDYLGDGVFFNRSGQYGKIYELDAGVYDEPLTERELGFEFDKFQRFLADILPGLGKSTANTVVQVICSQRKAASFPELSAKTPAGEILKREVNHVASLGLINRRFIIAVLWQPQTSFLSQLKADLKISLTSNPESYFEKLTREKDFFLRQLKRIENSAEVSFRSWSDKDYIAYVNSVLNPGKKLDFDLGAEPFHYLSKNIFTDSVKATGKGFDLSSGKNIRSFYWSQLPAHFILGRFKTFLSKLPMTDYEICWTMSHGEISLKMEHGARLLWFSRGPAFEEHKKDWDSLRKKINGRNPYGKMSLSLTTYNVDEDIETAVSKASTLYLGSPVVLEERHGPQMITRSLPLNTTPEENSILGRFTTKSLDTAIGFLPIYDGPRGEGVRLWMNNRRFPTWFNLFSGEQNRTGFVLGRMGAGKSVLNGSLILEFKEQFPSGLVRVIDIKSSYAKLCDLLSGKLVSFTEEDFQRRPFSPFAVEKWENADIALVRSFLCSSIALLNPDAQIGIEHTEIIDEALKICANLQEEDKEWSNDSGNDVDPHFVWSDVKSKLEVAAEQKNHKDMKIVGEILRWTSAFDKTGSYGFLFNTYEARGQSDLSEFVVYDLGNMDDEKLKTMAAQLVSMKVTRDLRKVAESVPKFVVFEELGVYLTGEDEKTQAMANRFVVNITKTVRKIGGIPYGITNAVEDFLTKEGGVSFLNQAVTQIYLPFTDSMVQSLVMASKGENSKISLNEADIDIIRNLEIKDGEYSQAYVISKVDGRVYKGVINMPLSPSMYALLNTNPTPRARYNELRSSGYSAIEAIDSLAQDFEKKRSKRQ